MATAELIAIGTELLLGEIQDTNTRYITRQLRQIGVDVFRTTVVGDNPLRIADVMRESLSRAEIVVTTGGLGPTIDDPTRNAAALAYQVDVEFHTDLWDQISERFQSRGISPSENNKKQAFIPAGAIAIHNPVGTAPAFYMFENNKILVCLPGVPREMERILQESVIPLLKTSFKLTGIIKARVLHTVGLGESRVDMEISDLETLVNPTVGLSAHPGIVDIRITAKALNEASADNMIAEIETAIRQRLEKHVFGADEETLSGSISKILKQQKNSINIRIYGISESALKQYGLWSTPHFDIEPCETRVSLESEQPFNNKTAVFGVNFAIADETAQIELFHFTSGGVITEKHAHSGPPTLGETWGINNTLEFVRRMLMNPRSGKEE